MKAIYERSSVRTYTDEPVEEEKILKLLEAAMQAPTAGNQQEWEFIIINDKKLLNELSTVSKYALPVKHATVAIVLVADLRSKPFPQYWEQDLGAASQNILLEAVELGLGGVWLGVAPEQDRMELVSQILNIPDYIKPFAIIPIGYPETKSTSKSKFQQAKIHYNMYDIK